ncbi:MAG: 2-amino-4-hydroxy-6-hydroxymethyldihydropteridine diphosphokinase [Bacteroidota bacterium]|nr:2-amino-4-hydroxy-6-hydroxymethyldihydropteridine diphosphokinase [Bacteroidota bacterium]MDP4233136.1 2-amino-4-hydroxy-6-hydroxymethyldihydropteridine diphosphokinase [Bacteroidota bacterium]MDP4241719.1 2-amino-4-hydroxy-6-hydroxymethyldihydropteridine diphosphokinase [Bacteroidota bacterium]MDP4287377.1 2-amino-4-hydroxy-6-hydroxymethyldihydropteridine diphosphokinase [Bacteroidota bacterium]
MRDEGIELARVFIGLGSNIEPRSEHIESAVALLRSAGEVAKISPVYETEPIGEHLQPMYLNAVVELLTQEGPLELLAKLKSFEHKIGRKDRPRWHEREIDFDILFYEDLILNSADLMIPHPEISHRAFVLAPLADLDVNFVHPVLHRTIWELLKDVDCSGIHKTDIALA